MVFISQNFVKKWLRIGAISMKFAGPPRGRFPLLKLRPVYFHSQPKPISNVKLSYSFAGSKNPPPVQHEQEGHGADAADDERVFVRLDPLLPVLRRVACLHAYRNQVKNAEQRQNIKPYGILINIAGGPAIEPHEADECAGPEKR